MKIRILLTGLVISTSVLNAHANSPSTEITPPSVDVTDIPSVGRGEVPLRQCDTRFTVIPPLQNGIFFPDWAASGISDNGNVIVGTASDNLAMAPFKWTRMRGTNFFPPNVDPDTQQPIEMIGTHVAGSRRKFAMTTWLGLGAYVFQSGSYTLVPDPVVPGVPYPNYLYPSGFSRDGSTLIAWGTQIPRAYRWRQTEGTLELPPLNGDTLALPADTSANGDIVVGMSISDFDTFRVKAVRWSANRVPFELAPLPGDTSSNAVAVSANGNRVLGTSGNNRVVFWNRLGLVQDLGFNAEILGASNSFSRIVSAYTLWSEETGLLELFELLRCNNLIPTDLLFYTLRVSAISGNGRTVLGNGTLTNGQVRPFIVDLGGLSALAACDCSNDSGS